MSRQHDQDDLADELEQRPYEAGDLEPVTRYTVTWSMDIFATSPQAASIRAVAVMRNPHAASTWVDVRERNSTHATRVWTVRLGEDGKPALVMRRWDDAETSNHAEDK